MDNTESFWEANKHVYLESVLGILRVMSVCDSLIRAHHDGLIRARDCPRFG